MKDFHSALEECLMEGLSFRQGLNLFIPLLCHFLGTGCALIRFTDEKGKQVSLKTSDFRPEWSQHIPGNFPEGEEAAQILEIDQSLLIAVSLKDSESYFGLCCFVFTPGEGKGGEKTLIALAEYASSLIGTGAMILSPEILEKNRLRKALSRQFSRGHIEKLLSEKEPFLPVRKEEAVILRCELTSFIPLCEQILRTPRRVDKFLTLWTEALRKTVYHYGGVFLQRTGPSVQCLFGPPFFESTPEDLVNRAILASRDILERIRLLGEQPGIQENLPLTDAGEGVKGACVIHCGPAVLGFFGPFHEYSGEGRAMIQAERLKSHAAGGSVLITEAALSHVPGGPLGIQISPSESVDFEGPRMIVTDDVTEPMDYYRCVFSSV